MTITELLALIKQIRSNDKGVTAMEYGVIAAAVIVALTVAMGLLTPKLKGTFAFIGNNLTSST